jgi:riboflavin kinase/FMN adenylyltransferase
VRVIRLASLEPRGFPRPAVAIGNFDGVHRGHQALVAVAVRDGRQAGGEAVVLTFDPHPSRVLAPDRSPRALMTVEQKAEILDGLGVDVLAVLPFTAELSREAPEAFVEKVIGGCLGAQTVVVGTGFRFGHRRAGDLARLEGLGARLGFRVHGVPPVVHEGEPISSTRIREALSRGDVAAAGALLGRPFFVDGVVTEGDGRGRGLGFPTANLALRNETLPGLGVYACRCRRLDGAGEPRACGAVVNVGRRPTFGGGHVGVEAHLLDFEGDLYGASLRVAFVERLREEQRFSGPEALVAQIARDVARARELLSSAAAGAV